MTDRHCQLESRNAESSRLHAISHQASVTGSITVDSTYAYQRIVVINGAAQLGRWHRAYIRRQPEFFCHINVVQDAILGYSRRRVDNRDLPAYHVKVWESVHDLGHHIFIKHHNLLVKLLIISTFWISPEQISYGIAYVFHDKVKLLMGNPKLRPSQPFRVPIHKIRHCQIIAHPSVTEESLQIGRLCHELRHHRPVPDPARIVVPGI